jgi:hypothetical protein
VTTRTPTTSRVPTTWWLLGLAALPLVACKAKTSSDAPSRDVRSWTVAEIEAELDRNDRVLANEGIMIAMATPTVAPPEPAPATEPEAGPEAGPPPDEAHEGTDPDDGGQPATEPAPELAGSAQPTAVTEPSESYDAKLYEDERGRERRRARIGSRSPRRDEGTRCERVCELAVATCELETQICELAARHPDEPRYEQACLRAEQQCLAASQACERCVD